MRDAESRRAKSNMLCNHLCVWLHHLCAPAVENIILGVNLMCLFSVQCSPNKGHTPWDPSWV